MTAVIAGSFDPITLGHIDLIKRAHALFGNVVVLVATNSEKKYHFSRSVRTQAIRACFAGQPDITVEEWHGLTADYVRELGDAVLVRGARSGTDYDAEKDLYDINHSLAEAETLILPSKNEYRFISSCFVRELIRYGKDISPYVAPEALAVLKNEM